MKNLRTEITIHASLEKVWNVLMDHSQYKEWNPFIVNIEGDATVGSQIAIELHLPGRKPMNMSPKVLNRESQKEFRWKGHLFVPGLFDGEHFFQLEPINENETKLIHGEHFSGVLSGVLLKMIGEDTQKGFIAMNESLRKRCEM